MSYEFEKAKRDEKLAKGVVASAIIGLVGFGINKVRNDIIDNQNKNRINQIEGKKIGPFSFATRAEKEECRKLKEKK